ncbi:MAG: hypothetical protein GY870_15675 [archaeon]|nr:hypothetical protein [archaeon]
MAASIEEQIMYCKKCDKVTVHHRNVKKMSVIAIIINIIMVFITTGLWIIPLVLYLLLKPKNSSPYVCKVCGEIMIKK